MSSKFPLYSADATSVSDVAATKRSKKHIRGEVEGMGSDGEYEEVDQGAYLLSGQRT